MLDCLAYFKVTCQTIDFRSIKMTNWLKISILLVLAATTLGNEESTSAKLLFSKQILNKYLVEGMDIVIR